MLKQLMIVAMMLLSSHHGAMGLLWNRPNEVGMYKHILTTNNNRYFESSHCIHNRGVTMIASAASTTVMTSASSNSKNNQLSPTSNSLSERIRKGSITAYEINRMFKITRTQLDNIERSSSTGFTGVMIGLESCMVDLTSAFGYSYSILAGDLNQPTPDPIIIRDLLGSTFKDYSIALGLNIPPEYMIKYEMRFYAIFEKVLERIPHLPPTTGCRELLSTIINDNNDITVVTSLPRSLALKVLAKSGLSNTFETRVNPDRLLCHNIDDIIQLIQSPSLAVAAAVDSSTSSSTTTVAAASTSSSSSSTLIATDTATTTTTTIASPSSAAANDIQNEVSAYSSNYGDKYLKQRIHRSCAIMKKPTVLTVCIDGNRRQIVAAKRTGDMM